MESFFFVLGAVFGFLGVAAGAFGAHALKDRLSPHQAAVFELAVRYQMVHAPVLLLVGSGLPVFAGNLARAAGWFFTAGTIVFSGSLYALALSGKRAWGAVTPLGGLGLLAGWACLALAALGGLA